MKYLELLESKIWQSDRKNEQLQDLLYCELEKVNFILTEASEEYNHNHNHSERLDSTYEFENKYKEKVIELLEKLELNK